MAYKKHKIDLIITRNKKDFKNEWIEVQTPQDYLDAIFTEKSSDSVESDE